MDSVSPAASPAASARSLQLTQTFSYFAAFIGLGFVSAMFGPTLAGLAANTGSTLGAISIIFVANSLGRMAGSLIAGRLIDRVQGHPIIAAGFAAMALCMALIPNMGALAMLVVIFFCIGIAQNFIDVGANTLIVWVHGRAVGPYMNALHLTFGIGAFFTPIIAATALSASGNIHLGYTIVAALLLPLAVWMLRLPSPPQRATVAHGAAGDARWGLLILVALFFFVLVGSEVGMSAWTYSYAQAMGFRDAATAAALTSTYWAMYSLGRLIAIPISTRVPAHRMLYVDLVGLIVSASILVLFAPVSPAAIWIGVAGIGLSVASVFPTMLTFTGSHMNVTGKINGVLFATANLGSMFFPWLIGQLFEPAGPQSLARVVLGIAAASLLLFIFIHRLSNKTQLARA
jgi:FHS family Na+ dependent glucose MFS transporter 1